jgi:hypothetical protein
MLFSVGDAGGAVVAGGGVVVDVVVVVVVVVVEGACLPAVSHPAVIATIATTAAPPATATMRRLTRLESVVPVRCRESIIIRTPFALARKLRARNAAPVRAFAAYQLALDDGDRQSGRAGAGRNVLADRARAQDDRVEFTVGPKVRTRRLSRCIHRRDPLLLRPFTIAHVFRPVAAYLSPPSIWDV